MLFVERLELMAAGKWDSSLEKNGSFLRRLRSRALSIFRRGPKLNGSVDSDERKVENGAFKVPSLLSC